MNILQEKLKDANWLDLFSGSGIMSCEAIQKGAKAILAVELNKTNYKTCKENILSISNSENHNVHVNIINSEANKLLKLGFKKYLINLLKQNYQKQNKFDLIYIDPPFKLNLYSSVLKNLIKGDWVKENAIAICETSKKTIFHIPSEWSLKTEKNYGEIKLFFLTPNPE